MFKFNLKNTLGFLLIFFAQAIYADVSPFGVTIGKSSYDEVKKIIGSKTKMIKSTKNIFNGKNLYYRGTGLGLQGLKRATFAFYEDDTLAAVILELPKRRYAEITSSLKSKYNLVSEEAPFVGNKSVSFREGDVTIEALAPHMNFEMEVHYMHDKSLEMYNNHVAKDDANAKKTEVSAL